MSKSEFARNVLTLMTGTTIAQAIPILLSPILTRIYTDEDYGLFAPLMSLVTGLLTIAALRYDLAIVLPKSEGEAKSMVKLSRKIAIIVSILITLSVIFFINPIVVSLKSEPIKNWYYVVGLLVFVLIQINIIQSYLNRKKEYNLISKSKMLQGGGVAVSQVVLGSLVFTGGASGLILGYLIGQLGSLAYLFKKTNKEFLDVENQDKYLLSKYKKMPLLNGPNAVVDAVRTNGINIIIVNLFATAILGQFSLAWRILQAPLGLINGAFSKVCFQQLSVLDKSKHFNFLKKNLVRSFLIGILPFTILYFFSPVIFSFIYGENWKLAGEIGAVLVPWLFLNLLTSPISTYFIVVEKQGRMLIFAVFYMLVPFVALWYFRHDFLTAIKALSYSMSLMLLVFIFIVLYTSKRNNC